MHFEFHQDDTEIEIYLKHNSNHIRATLGSPGEGSLDTPITKEEALEIIELMFKNIKDTTC